LQNTHYCDTTFKKPILEYPLGGFDPTNNFIDHLLGKLVVIFGLLIISLVVLAETVETL
jgi:hypothetical protein